MVFRATPLLGNQEERCRTCLSALLVIALQKNALFVFFVGFVVPNY
jgi:hypothetical protein